MSEKTQEPVRPRAEKQNEAFVQFATEAAQAMTQNHDVGVMAGVLVSMDGNGYISIASFALAPQGISILLEYARALNDTKTPTIEKRVALGETVNELTAADAPIAALEADTAERPTTWTAAFS